MKKHTSKHQNNKTKTTTDEQHRRITQEKHKGEKYQNTQKETQTVIDKGNKTHTNTDMLTTQYNKTQQPTTNSKIRHTQQTKTSEKHTQTAKQQNTSKHTYTEQTELQT